MIYQNMEFHNAAELIENLEHVGVIPYRYPAHVRNALEGYGVREAESCRGCEIRFVTGSDKIKVTVTPEQEDGDIIIFKGDYLHSVHRVKADETAALEIQEPERFSWVTEDILNKSRFSPKVWRVFLDLRYVKGISIDTFGFETRPPQASELPKLRWLAYGSSITYGVGAINNTSCYVQQAARRIKADVINLGLPGSCYCEKEVSDFIAGRDDWDFATLEVGVNMRAVHTEEQFRERVSYLIDSIARKHMGKPIVLINLFPNHAIYSKNGSIYEKDHRIFTSILNEIPFTKNYKNLSVLSGEDILQEFDGLTTDLIHPGDAGHIIMGENLARRLEKILKTI